MVMPNGVDFPKGKADAEEIRRIDRSHSLPEGVPIYLYVGRMMWYKNIRVILDSLQRVKRDGHDFRLIMVGKGSDENAIDRHIARLGLKIRLSAPENRRSRAAARLLQPCRSIPVPIHFDTHGIVVREAAACGCPSLLVSGSSSACGITEGINGFTAGEDPEAFARKIIELTARPELLKTVGRTAMESLYLSWDEAVTMAYRRYENLCANWPYPLPCHTQL